MTNEQRAIIEMCIPRNMGVKLAECVQAALDQIDAQAAEIARLREAISPGRWNKGIEYYEGVARRMRDRELRITPMEVGICKRDAGHEGPCNGFPNTTCPVAAVDHEDSEL